ncbi:MAG TPA: NAD(P)H-hydrate dehydratase [Kofleriaceae bacterium]|jgi:NAD(P)H-hydrate epimerase
MRPAVTAAEMRALDAAAIESLGIPGFTLMETAGRAVADAAARMAPAGARVAVVCGPGNNGGDGFVVARVLRDRRYDAVVYLAVSRDAVKGSAAEHLAVLERAGGVVRSIATAAALAEQRDAIRRSTLAIDALFGVGLARPIEGHLADVVAAINAAPQRLAVDIPSGLDTDTGETLGVAVDANATVTMAALKIALVSAPGFARCGDVTVAEIGIPPALVASSARAELVEHADIRRVLPISEPLDHKGTRGHVVICGGSPGMRGAGRLAAVAALRAGAGLCTLAAAAGDAELVAPDSIMVRALGAGEHLDLERKAAVVIGPGLGKSADAATRLADVLAAGVPAVLDADALNLVGHDLARIAAAAGPVVLTPHPGEAARLLGIDTAAVEADRLAAARHLAAATRAVVVLKGARTIVCDGTLEDDHCAINPTGGPSLGTGGSGDVLAGVIGALLAQGLAPGDAARAGVYVHGAAGDALAAVHGARGVMSSDLPDAIATQLK